MQKTQYCTTPQTCAGLKRVGGMGRGGGKDIREEEGRGKRGQTNEGKGVMKWERGERVKRGSGREGVSDSPSHPGPGPFAR